MLAQDSDPSPRRRRLSWRAATCSPASASSLAATARSPAAPCAHTRVDVGSLLRVSRSPLRRGCCWRICCSPACRALVVLPLRGDTATALLRRGHLHGDCGGQRGRIRRRLQTLVARQAVGPSFRGVPRSLRAGGQGSGTARAGVGSSQGQNPHGRQHGPTSPFTAAVRDRRLLPWGRLCGVRPWGARLERRDSTCRPRPTPSCRHRTAASAASRAPPAVAKDASARAEQPEPPLRRGRKGAAGAHTRQGACTAHDPSEAQPLRASRHTPPPAGRALRSERTFLFACGTRDTSYLLQVRTPQRSSSKQVLMSDSVAGANWTRSASNRCATH